MKPGRNDPCPCGSGRKFKRCCGAEPATPIEGAGQLAWRRIRRLLDDHYGQLQRFAMSDYGPEGFHEAWGEFTFPFEGESFDPDSPHFGIFRSWFLHFWSPDPHDTRVKNEALHGVEPTRAFLARHGSRLDAPIREYFESCLEEPVGFHEALRVEPGKGMLLKEIFGGSEQEIVERSASETALPGDIFFGQVVRAGGIGMLECCSSFSFPPIAKIELAERRREFMRGRKRSTFRLREYDFEMLEIYWEMAERALNPKIPELCNTDGDPMSPRKIVFDIDSPQQAFDALRHLDPTAERDLLAEAQRDGSGGLKGIRFAWIRPGEGSVRGLSNTVLANIRIDGQRLVAEVNSEARETKLRQIVASALGKAARHRATEIQSMERLLEEARSERATRREEPDVEGLANAPELEAIAGEFLRRHYEGWVSERIPALGNRTPLQAVRSRAGREAVEALVRQLERDGQRMRPPLDPDIVRRLRERLGIVGPA